MAMPSPNTTGKGRFPAKLNDLSVTLVIWAPAAKPSGKEVANLKAPKSGHVCILNDDDYIAVTGLRSCTGLAVYDAASKLAGMYHFGGQFKDNEPTELGEFARQLSGHIGDLGRLQLWLFGSKKCGYADALLTELRKLGLTRTPSVMEIDVGAHGEAAFYLLGTGVVTHQLT
jgi:hypothetical protein